MSRGFPVQVSIQSFRLFFISFQLVELNPIRRALRLP